jgi:hypothetical protein
MYLEQTPKLQCKTMKKKKKTKKERKKKKENPKVHKHIKG